MKTNFKNYLKKKKTQDVIDKYSKEYENKKIILYGVDLFTGDLFRNYDLSKLNIIGVTDPSFERHKEGEFYGYPKLSPIDLIDKDFDLLLITTYDDVEHKFYIRRELFKGRQIKFKLKTLISMNVFEYIKSLLNGDF